MTGDVYTGWSPERWSTPISDVRLLDLESLVDDGALHLTVQAGNGARWRLTFESAPAYLSLLEEYRLALWGRGMSAATLGATWRVPDSPWLNRLRREEPLIDVHHPGLQHFVVLTESAVIDVLAVREATITLLDGRDPSTDA